MKRNTSIHPPCLKAGVFWKILITVTLTHDVRDDDAESILNALRMVRGVAVAELGPAVSSSDHLNRRAALMEFVQLWDEFTRLAVFGDGGERYKQVRDLLATAHRERTGRAPFS